MIKKFFFIILLFCGVYILAMDETSMQEKQEKCSLLGQAISEIDTPVIIVNTTTFNVIFEVLIKNKIETQRYTIPAGKSVVLSDVKEFEKLKNIKISQEKMIMSYLTTKINDLELTDSQIREINFYNFFHNPSKNKKQVFLRIALTKDINNPKEDIWDFQYPTIIDLSLGNDKS